MRTPEKSDGSAPGSRTDQKMRQRPGAERAEELDEFGIGAAQPIGQRDDDREEADQRDDDRLREQPEAEPEHQQRRQRDDRDGLRGDQQRIDRAAQPGREVDQRGEDDPATSAAAKPTTVS